MGRLTAGLALLTGLSIPLSTSLSEVATTLFMLSWLCSGNLSARWSVIRRSPVAKISLGLFALLAGSCCWSVESWSIAVRWLLKYRELLQLPMFLVIFRDPRLRKLGAWSFLTGMALLLALSYSEMLMGADYGIKSTPDDWGYVIGKDRIIHGLLVALCIYLGAVELLQTLSAQRGAGLFCTKEGSVPQRYRNPQVGMWLALILTAAYNVLCMVHGRTGYVVLAALTILFCCQVLGRRGMVVAALLMAAGLGCATAGSTTFRGRVNQTLAQIRNHFGPERKHSEDPRLEYYSNSLTLIRRHPWLGTGMGSFKHEYLPLIARTGDAPAADPHNEYLHLAIQAGLPATGLFVLLLCVQGLGSARLPLWERRISRGVLATIALGSLFNSLILSVTGGLIWAYLSGLASASDPAITATQPHGAETDPQAAPLQESSAAQNPRRVTERAA